MMTRSQKWKRFLAGMAVAISAIVLGFVLVFSTIHTYGATPEEVSMPMPGDLLYTDPVVNWTHAITIDAPVETVWPWVIQMGDDRGGFYSYTFIENLIMGKRVYVNASEIHPEWQTPAVGEGMIVDLFKFKEYEPNRFLLAAIDDQYGLSWVWLLEPRGQEQTRLIVRMKIQTPVEFQNPVLTGVMDAGGFVMEKGMLDGIQLRAEGGRKADWVEFVEIGLWLSVLVEGIVAAVLFMKRPNWQKPLAVGLAVVAALFVLTFVQPAIALRGLIVLLLFAALIWAAGKPEPAVV